MNKKLLILVGIAALGLGSVGAIALQSHAQQAIGQSAPTSAPIVTSAPQQENTTTDTDNVQDDKNGIEKPDAAISDTDKETNDDKNASSTVKQGDTKEQSENSAADTNETEDGN